MSIITIMLFFIYTYGLGFSVTSFFKNSNNFFERNIMRIGIGLGTFAFLLVLFDFLHIPIDWKIILLVSLVVPLFFFIRIVRGGFKLPGFRLSKSNLYLLIALLIFSLTLFMYVKGAFTYPYFEDDDPWVHATGIKHVSIEENLDDPNNNFKYIKPYPPSYDALMAVLHQTSPSLMWTMKFFNALIISLGIVFFFFFAKNFMQSISKALVATTVLAMVPCYLSHFIWAHSLVITLLIVALYCFVMIDQHKGWIYPTALVIAAMCLTQPSQTMKFFVVAMIFFIVKSIFARRFLFYHFASIFIGYFLSLIWWAFNFKEQLRIRAGGLFEKPLEEGSWISGLMRRISSMSTGGTADRAYTFGDFFIAKSQNMINNPVGVGVVLCLIALLSLVVIVFTYRLMKEQKKEWIVITLLWLLFTFIGMNTVTFNIPFHLFAFRFWMLFALPLSILISEGFVFVVQFLKQFKIPKIATVSLLVILIFLTSGQQKYAVNTANWPPGQMWTSMEEVQGYVWLRNLPIDTKVFAYSSDEQIIGFDKYSCMWCDSVMGFRKDIINKNASELYSFLRSHRYEYLVIDGMAFRDFSDKYGENRSNQFFSNLLEDIESFGSFQPIHQTQGVVIFKIL